MAYDFKPTLKSRSTSQGIVHLPPAGNARQEVLKARTDQLAEAAETKAAQLGAESIPHEALEPDYEIINNFDGLAVSEKQPSFIYKWVLFDNPIANKGYWVNQAKISGWQVVCGDMPEAKEHEIVGGMRKIGDTVLMRIPAARYAVLEAKERASIEARERAVNSNLMELGRKRGVIVKVDEGLDKKTLNTMEARARGSMAATQKFDRALRDGTLAP